MKNGGQKYEENGNLVFVSKIKKDLSKSKHQNKKKSELKLKDVAVT